MSRIGKSPLAVPAGVKVSAAGGRLVVAGPKGAVETFFPPELSLAVEEGGKSVRLGRRDDSKKCKALHGTFRRLLGNMVTGVVTPFERELDIVGVGYQAKLQQNAKLKRQELRLQVGFANAVDVPVPKGITVECPSATSVKVTGPDKALVGQFAANVRKVRPPEPYNGKGIKYRDERIQRKQGKSFVSSE
ncbi:MAG: 50S ribosomal protein L6 [Planctomycetaceae bacterium]|nr:50S ribosomal protein L6 [Planctomycetota bacterium]NUN51895.1 50S ribosomal protein L6 [Planctomycetaceae bacterium]